MRRTASIGTDFVREFRRLFHANFTTSSGDRPPSVWTHEAAGSPFRFQLPTCHRILTRDNFVILYDQSRRIPLLVAETLTKESLVGDAKRRSTKFYEEVSIPRAFRSTRDDFKGSGFDRGHLAPAGNNKRSKAAMKQTFSFANILPQNHWNNRGVWNELEMYCQSLTLEWDAVHVITGHVMKPALTKDVDGNRIKIVTYEMIGKSEVAVPTHLFKVVLCQRQKRKEQKETEARRNSELEQESNECAALNLGRQNEDPIFASRHAICADDGSQWAKDEMAYRRAPPPNYPYPYSRDRAIIADELRLTLESFLVPNVDVGGGKTIDDFRTSLRIVEKYSGCEMFREWKRWIVEK